jgi:hypothetical protein
MRAPAFGVQLKALAQRLVWPWLLALEPINVSQASPKSIQGVQLFSKAKLFFHQLAP